MIWFRSANSHTGPQLHRCIRGRTDGSIRLRANLLQKPLALGGASTDEYTTSRRRGSCSPRRARCAAAVARSPCRSCDRSRRNVHVDHVGLRIEVIVPHVLQQHRAGHDLAGMPHQIFEQAELARLQLQFLSGATDLDATADRARDRRRDRAVSSPRRRAGAPAPRSAPAIRRTRRAWPDNRRRPRASP